MSERKRLVMCQACRGLIDPSVKTCPLCGKDSVPPLLARATGLATTDHFFSRLILTINIALFAMMVLADMRSEAASVMESPSSQVLYDFGGRNVELISRGQWWRLITPNFLHLGIAHIMFNSMALFQIGPQVEEIYGSQKFIFIYLGTGIISNIAAYAFGVHGGGASGAIYGLIGLMAIYGRLLGGSIGRDLMRQMLIWAGIGFLMSFVFGWDNVSHAGGFISGALCGYLIKPEEPVTRRSLTTWNVVAVLAAVLVTVSFVMTALNYGKWQNGREVIRLDRRIAALQVAIDESIDLPGGDARQAGELAGRLRSKVADLETISSIDRTSDEIRKRLVNLANKRAALFDNASTNPSAITEAALADANELVALQAEYDRWASSIVSEYGLVREAQPR